MPRYDDKREEHKKKNDYIDSDDECNSTDSEDDYELSQEVASNLSSESGLPLNLVIDLWKSQRGICRLSDIPMTTDNGLYSCVIAPRIVTKAISESNACMVCNVVNSMREVTGLPWKPFVALLGNIAKDEF